MIEGMEVLLLAWGREMLDPRLEVSLRSALGSVGEDAGGGGAGGRCLSTVECWAAISQASQAVAAALVGLAQDAPGGLGARGRVLCNLASVRYCQPARLPVGEQCRRLGISERTYRSRVDELHAELAKVLPGVASQQDQERRRTDAHAATLARRAAAREAAREQVRQAKRQQAVRQAHARAVRASARVAD